MIMLLAATAAVFSATMVVAGGMEDHLHDNPAHVQAELDHLVDSVHHASVDAQSIHGLHGDVVDLGASLRIMEDKFTGLRNALMVEMGLKTATNGDHAGGTGAGVGVVKGHAEDLVKRGSEMIAKMGKSRTDVHVLLSEVAELESTMKGVRHGMEMLDVEMQRLDEAISDVHVDHSIVHGAHADLKAAISSSGWRAHDVPLQHAKNMGRRDGGLPSGKGTGGRLLQWYYLLGAEIVVLMAFLGYKRFTTAGARGSKYSKLG
jgi:outer membrane murein-binding lipoprotein Lpp